MRNKINYDKKSEDNPLVSVLMITYNHEAYIAEAIEGVIQQKCEFSFELIIGEDSSLDSTRKIALDYQNRYPHIIRVIYSEKNVGMNANACRIFEAARGKYVAYCEGDDFWCDSNKLAKQVELIENNEKIGIVHSDWTRANKVQEEWCYDYKKSVHRRVNLKYLEGNIFKTWHYPKVLRTCTILLRRSDVASWYASGLMDSKYHFGDSVLNAWITDRAYVGYLPSVMAVYRVSPNSALRSGANARVAFYKSALEFDTAARTFFTERLDYPNGYRWDAAAGLLLWGLRAHDWNASKIALLDFKKYFNLKSFLVTGIQTFIMRLPTLRRQPRNVPRRF